MTTPQIKHMSPQQVAKIHAESWWDRLITASTPPWTCPPPDHPPVVRDKATPGATRPITWGRYDLPLTVGPSTLTEPAFGAFVQSGMPVEQVPFTTPKVPVYVNSPWHGHTRTELVPIAQGENQLEMIQGAKPTAWVEGMPQYGGAYDHHWLGVYPDGSCWEMIGMRWTIILGVGWAWACDEAGFWDKTGKLVSGDSVTAAGLRLSAQLVTPQVLADPSVVGVAFPNYADRDGTDKTAPIRCGDWLKLKTVPAGLTGDALKLATLLNTKGMRIFDRFGDDVKAAGLVTQAGERWVGSNLTSLKLRTTDFEVVV